MNSLFIGSDCFWSLVTGKVRRAEAWANSHSRKAGMGPLRSVTNTKAATPTHSFLTTHVLRTDASPLPTKRLDVLHLFWKLESLGISSLERSVLKDFTHVRIRTPAARLLRFEHQRSQGSSSSLEARYGNHAQIRHHHPDPIAGRDSGGVNQIVECSVECSTYLTTSWSSNETTKLWIVYDASVRFTGCSPKV